MKTQYLKARNGLIPLFLTLFLGVMASPAAAQGKRVSIGTGTGELSYPTAQATLNLHDDDTLVINAGVYQGITLGNITAGAGHRIYVINNGLVEVAHSWVGFDVNHLTNVTIEGDGTPGIPYGFYVHDMPSRGMSILGRLTSTYLSYFRFENIGDYAIYLIDNSLTYTGDNSGLFYDMKFLHFKFYTIKQTVFQFGDWSQIDETGLVGMIRKLEIAYCNIENVTDNAEIIHLNKTVNANIHHNRIVHTGFNDFRHAGIIFLRGNGDVHHNYISDHWGNGMRGQGFGLDTIGAINFYNNVVINSRKYSGVECNSYPGDVNVSPYTRYCNYKVDNNTFGNLTAVDWQAAMVDSYNAYGGFIEIKNNIGFNIQKDQPFDPTRNYVYTRLNATLPDTANNLYNPSYLPLGLVDDSSCLLNVNSIAIDKGTNFSWINDDVDGVPRPQNGIFDIGAHEYKSGVIYPVSNAGSNINLVLPKDSTLLDGTASYNPGGGVLKYAWSVVSGPASFSFAGDTTVTPQISQLTAGTYLVKLVVTNSDGRTNQSTVTVTVYPASAPPVANAGGDISITLPVNSATLNGSLSSNPAGGTLTYAWLQVSGPSAASITGGGTAPAVGSLVEGAYQFQLTVTNSSGVSAKDTVIVTVNPAPPPGSLPPVAIAGNAFIITLPTNTVSLDGSASYDPGGGALRYSWTVTSGPSAYSMLRGSTANPLLSGLVVGTYHIVLTVTNISGLTNSNFVEVTVNPAILPSNPVAKTGADTTVSFPNGVAQLNGSASYAQGGASIASYSWAQLSGPTVALLNNGKISITSAGNLEPGNYVFELTVTDNNGLTGTTQLKVAVVNTFRLAKTISVYPNPCADQLHIHLITDSSGPMVVRITSSGGAIVLTQSFEKTQMQFDQSFPVSRLAAGVYMIEVIIGNQVQLLSKFVKQ